MIATSFLIGSSSILQVTRTAIKSWMSSNSGQSRLSTSELLALEWQKKHIWPCPIDSAFNFDRIFIKLAGNWSSHKFSDEFEFRRYQTIHLGVICPWEPKRPIVDLVRSIATSFWIGCSSNLQVTRIAIKSRISLISGQIGLFSLELLALERWNIFTYTYNGDNVVQMIAASLLIQSSSILQVTRTAITSRMTLTSSHIRLFTSKLLALECWKSPHLSYR